MASWSLSFRPSLLFQFEIEYFGKWAAVEELPAYLLFPCAVEVAVLARQHVFTLAHSDFVFTKKFSYVHNAIVLGSFFTIKKIPLDHQKAEVDIGFAVVFEFNINSDIEDEPPCSMVARPDSRWYVFSHFAKID